MATKEEMRSTQKRQLIQLKMLETKQLTLKQLITMTVAEMDKEDVAWVEKSIREMEN